MAAPFDVHDPARRTPTSVDVVRARAAALDRGASAVYALTSLVALITVVAPIVTMVIDRRAVPRGVWTGLAVGVLLTIAGFTAVRMMRRKARVLAAASDL